MNEVEVFFQSLVRKKWNLAKIKPKMSLHTRRSALDKINAGLGLFKFARILEISLPLMFGLLCMGFLTLSTFVLILCFSQSFSLWIWSIFQTILCVKETSPGGRGTPQSFIRKGCALRSNPITLLHITFGRKGNPFLHCAFYWQMVPLSHT